MSFDKLFLLQLPAIGFRLTGCVFTAQLKVQVLFPIHHKILIVWRGGKVTRDKFDKRNNKQFQLNTCTQRIYIL